MRAATDQPQPYSDSELERVRSVIDRYYGPRDTTARRLLATLDELQRHYDELAVADAGETGPRQPRST